MVDLYFMLHKVKYVVIWQKKVICHVIKVVKNTRLHSKHSEVEAERRKNMEIS